MNNLPFEVNSLIFKQLDKKSLINCLYVNKSFANFIYKILWNRISLKNVKLLAKIWFENDDNEKNTDYSNVVNSNLMFPYNEAVTVIEFTYLNSITFDMERIINACKNVNCIVYQSSVIEKPLLKFQRPLYQWEFSNIPECKYSDNQILLKKIDKKNGLIINTNNEWDDRTVTMEEDNNISSINSDFNNYSSTEIEDEMSIVLNSIEQEFEITNEIIELSNNNEIIIIDSDNDLEVEENIVQDSDIIDIDTTSLQTNYNNFISKSTPTSVDSSCCWNNVKSVPFPILSNIKVLDFSNSCISPEVLESFIINCSNLEEIIFLKNDINDKSLQQFMKCKTLRYLHINFEISSWDDEFTYEGFIKFIDFCCEKLHKLYINSIKLLDKDMINYLVNHCPKNICSITFDSQNITSQEISCFIKQSTKLNELVIGSRFSKCNITKLPLDLNILYPDKDLLMVNSSELSLSNKYNNNNDNNNKVSYTLDSINSLFKNSKNTEWLRSLTKFEYHFEKMEDGYIDLLITIIKEMKNLEHLKLSGDVSFTNKNIFDLLLNLKNLKSLYLWIYNSEYNFNNFASDNINKAKNINNIILSNLKNKLLKISAIQHSNYLSKSNCSNRDENYNPYLNSIISSIYNDLHLIEMTTPFPLTSDCLELVSCGVCPKLKEISGYFTTDITPEQLENAIQNLSFLNTIFLSNFQFEQNNTINTITDDYQLKWKSFANKYKVTKPCNPIVNYFNELNEILISSHRMVLTFNESFIHRLKCSVEAQ
ncbi:hypothetical protein PIROE2DRAFT_60791 [Piromyces sp. E2]|nr:hypothetical protein PIROE2DRAFT_60791 [Piromyces sp. E2]|eukprot:OUM64270.1 hypothetical protein PIROE2DRAFT_60791 [Piromyces sp. E2]